MYNTTKRYVNEENFRDIVECVLVILSGILWKVAAALICTTADPIQLFQMLAHSVHNSKFVTTVDDSRNEIKKKLYDTSRQCKCSAVWWWGCDEMMLAVQWCATNFIPFSLLTTTMPMTTEYNFSLNSHRFKSMCVHDVVINRKMCLFPLALNTKNYWLQQQQQKIYSNNNGLEPIWREKRI